MAEPGTSTQTQADGGGFLAPDAKGHPAGRCFRCGKPTPPGQGLCDEHNPTHISGPSPTQMHATIFGGIVLGVIAFFLLASFAVGTTGPYATEVSAASTDPSGGLALSFVVTNEGESEGVADCRVTRDGVPRPDDFAFRTDPVPGGESIVIEQVTPAPPESSSAYVPEKASVVCT